MEASKETSVELVETFSPTAKIHESLIFFLYHLAKIWLR